MATLLSSPSLIHIKLRLFTFLSANYQSFIQNNNNVFLKTNGDMLVKGKGHYIIVKQKGSQENVKRKKDLTLLIIWSSLHPCLFQRKCERKVSALAWHCTMVKYEMRGLTLHILAILYQKTLLHNLHNIKAVHWYMQWPSNSILFQQIENNRWNFEGICLCDWSDFHNRFLDFFPLLFWFPTVRCCLKSSCEYSLVT